MGKLVVTEFVTLDGVMEDPGGSEKTPIGGFAFRFDRGPEGDRFKMNELQAADAQLLGRVTYEGFAAAWPAMGESDFGRKFNEMPKYVVSSTLTEPSWQNSTVLGPDLASEVTAVKERHSGDVLVSGSARLVQDLLALDLVDQLNLMVFPVVAGSGKRLFAEGAEQRAFDLVETGRAGATTTMILSRAR